MRREAERVRASDALGRSDMLIRLFDFLLERSLAGRTPREIEIAQDVFGKMDVAPVGEDASVRVYIHRLRRKLAAYYETAGASADGQLTIPLGDYRLILADAPAEPERLPIDTPPDRAAAAAAAAAKTRWTRRAIIGAGGAGLVALGIGIERWREGRDGLADAREAALWRDTAAAARPTMIVVGDYYIFGEAQDGVEVNRMIREFTINSRNDLDAYLMAHPDMMGRYVGLDLSYAPIGAVSALGTLLPLFTDRHRRPALIPASAITARMLRYFNLVYIGYLSGLGPLRDAIFGASRFRVGQSYDELIDTRTGRRYRADWEVVAHGGTPRRDYAYLAAVPGPNGNSITIVAGTRDAALMQAAEIATDPVELARMTAGLGSARAFEALYAVRSVANANLDGQLVVAAPIEPARMWQEDRSPALHFPDDASNAPAR